MIRLVLESSVLEKNELRVSGRWRPPPYKPNITDQRVCCVLCAGAVTSILVTMFVQDVPFVIIRVIVLIEHDFRGSDLIHPLKNSAFILFGLLQLYIIHRNQKTLKEKARCVWAGRGQQRGTRQEWGWGCREDLEGWGLSSWEGDGAPEGTRGNGCQRTRVKFHETVDVSSVLKSTPLVGLVR